ncbi:two-component system sporulation sensor kinase B [Bacillus ectoiniformans]|uniref:sensor histidine kinase n=1 Tax=Bacillus ectoiniformans TaxID=1494429 RepID=UPI00195C83E1|nr:HAMP domain-containing sensor histidine kinase [Bacillus ectoiniformans]MBM7648593.1 two-component system sporulation sensor kinase B [Bacillus ectoiniformans]
MGLTEHLVFSLSFLLVLLFFFQLWLERMNKYPDQFSYYIYFILSLLACMILTTSVSDEFYFDLRQIPLTLGALYLGLNGGYVLVVIMLAIRAFWGIDAGFWTAFWIYIINSSIVGLLHMKFTAQKLGHKVIFASVLTMLPSIIWGLVQLKYTSQTIHIEFMFDFLIIPFLSTIIITYTIESVKKRMLLKDQVIKATRVEAVSHLAAAISHEVRNPLTTIRGFLQLISDPSFSNEKRKEFSSVAIIELDRAESIISDYLTFAKPPIEEVSMIHVQEVLQRVAKVATPLANMNSVEISIEPTDDQWMKGDKNKLHQSLLNIVKNAIEAMPNGGFLSLETNSAHNKTRIIIRDTGVGMTTEQLARLGEPYFSTKGESGTGIGMMVTFSIIHAMKGVIEVESEPNKGTSFVLSFPAVKYEIVHSEAQK